METTIGRYQIIAELGRGGMAVVYRALDPNIGREVALKLMSREFLSDPEFHQRFAREARAIGALESSSIVPIYDFGEDKGQPYLVMRLMTGGSLVDKLRQGAMPIEMVNLYLNRLAEALDEAHSKGIIHRDLKPGNILLDQKRLPYLADFGIVKLLESNATMTGRGGAIGTPAYMSPEHFEGKVSARSDIYALGVIVYQMFTGKLPFQAKTASEWLKAHLMDAPIPLQVAHSGLPPILQTVLERALAKNPQNRYQSAGQFAHAINEVTRQFPTGQPLPYDFTPPATDNNPTLLRNPIISPKQFVMPPQAPAQKVPWGWLGSLVMIIVILLLVMGIIIMNRAPTSTANQILPTPIQTQPPVLTPTQIAAALPPTATAIPATATPLPATATAIPATATPLPPTATTVSATATPLPPTAIPATATPLPPTATTVSATATPLPPTATTPYIAPKVEATATTTLAKRPAISLEMPTIDQIFTDRGADIQFQWSESSPALADDEYYVLIINHRGEEDRTWLKTNHYRIDEKRWLADRGPDLFWQVVVAQKRTADPNEAPRGFERSEYGEQRKFIWALPGSGGGGDKDNGGGGSSDGGGDIY